MLNNVPLNNVRNETDFVKLVGTSVTPGLFEFFSKGDNTHSVCMSKALWGRI